MQSPDFFQQSKEIKRNAEEAKKAVQKANN